MTRIIGIDPGTALLGWGVIEAVSGRFQMVGYGALSTPAKADPALRLLSLYDQFRDILRAYSPEEAGVEELFFGKNVTTGIAVGQARGIVLLALAQQSIPMASYKPLVVKQAIAGYGGADKRQMQEMVRVTLKLDSIPKPDDAADALAIAICHAASSAMARRLRQSMVE